MKILILLFAKFGTKSMIKDAFLIIQSRWKKVNREHLTNHICSFFVLPYNRHYFSMYVDVSWITECKQLLICWTKNNQSMKIYNIYQVNDTKYHSLILLFTSMNCKLRRKNATLILGVFNTYFSFKKTEVSFAAKVICRNVLVPYWTFLPHIKSLAFINNYGLFKMYAVSTDPFDHKWKKNIKDKIETL